jgi:4'-phosphopantetheinyl transferase
MQATPEHTALAVPWSIGPKTPILDAPHIHLWYVSLPPARLLKYLAAHLSDDEQQRMERFRFPHLRQDFLVRRACLRLLLSRYLATTPESLIFNTGPYGKPYITPDAGRLVHFNLSHSGGAILYGFALEPLGVDIEKVRPVDDMNKLARRFFSPDEATLLDTVPEKQQLQAFFKIWTLKEAYIKARGTGLTTALDRFSVGIDPPRLIRADDIEFPQSWRLAEVIPDIGLVGALAVATNEHQLSFWRLGWEEL